MKAILLSREADKFQARVAEVGENDLHEGDVTVKVEYSTVNFKDALALTDKSPIVRKWPMVAGIDFAGVVEASAHPSWKPGDRALLNGWGVGETEETVPLQTVPSRLKLAGTALPDPVQVPLKPKDWLAPVGRLPS